jgi:hypothetical protein
LKGNNIKKIRGTPFPFKIKENLFYPFHKFIVGMECLKDIFYLKKFVFSNESTFKLRYKKLQYTVTDFVIIQTTMLTDRFRAEIAVSILIIVFDLKLIPRHFLHQKNANLCLRRSVTKLI